MTTYRRTWIALPLLALSLSLAACGSSTPTTAASGTAPAPASTTAGAASSLTVSGLVTEIKPAADSKGTTCPVAYDVASAGKTAGLTGAVAPSDDAVDAATDTSATGSDFLKKVAPAATLQCSYKVGDATVHTMLVAVSHANSAISAAIPVIAFWNGGDPSALIPFVQQVGSTPAGKAIAAPGTKAAVIRLKVESGDALLATSVDSTQPLTADQLTSLTESLAAQIH